jgi:hypothetical protein
MTQPTFWVDDCQDSTRDPRVRIPPARRTLLGDSVCITIEGDQNASQKRVDQGMILGGE